MKEDIMRSLPRLVSTVILAVGVLLLGSLPAYAFEPPGVGFEFADITGTNTNSLSWSGSYSCRGADSATLTITTTNLTGLPLLNRVITRRSLICPATGAEISGRIRGPLVGLERWHNDVKVTAELHAGSVTSRDTIEVHGNRDDLVTVDSSTLNADGSVSQTGTIRCSTAGGTGTLTITLTQDNPGGQTATGTETITLTCAATAGTAILWTDPVRRSGFASWHHGTIVVLAQWVDPRTLVSIAAVDNI
jgi:hypothetical protein